MIDLDYKSLIFENNQDGSWKSVELSNFSTYLDNANLNAKLEKLKTIYSTKSGYSSSQPIYRLFSW